MNRICYQEVFISPYQFLIASDEKGICLLHFSTADTEVFLSTFAAKNHLIPENKNTPFIQDTVSQLTDYFAGKLTTFTVSVSFYGTGFQQKVWTALLNIPYGETRSYTEQTAMLGDPLAIRAVASANGKNPIAIVVPCHRVIGSNGSLTGYAGGIEKKKWLLQLEQQHKLIKNTLF